jgi:hypothetical protein
MKPFTDIIKTSNKENMNIKWKKKESKMKKRRKCKSSEIFKKKLLIDKEKSMLSELREPMKLKREMLGLSKNSIWKRKLDFSTTLRLPEKDNSWKERPN